MKNIIILISVLIAAFCAGCATSTSVSNSDGTTTITPVIKVDSLAYQMTGKTSTIKGTVTVARGTTASLGAVTWGLGGVNYTSTLSGASTSESVTLTCPASLAVGNYTVTAGTPALTVDTYKYLTASASTTLHVVDLAAIYGDIVTQAAPTVKLAFETGTVLILKNNPDLVDTFSVSTTAAKAILSASDPSAAGFTAAIELAYPTVDKTIASVMGSALEAAYTTANAVYKSQSGSTTNLSLTGFISDAAYKTATDALLKAVTDGVAAGITDYKASL